MCIPVPTCSIPAMLTPSGDTMRCDAVRCDVTWCGVVRFPQGFGGAGSQAAEGVRAGQAGK